MRVTRQTLLRIARERTQELVYNDHTILAVYLTGSLASDADPMLGGAADIDLVLVHDSQPGLARQIVKLTPDFHLDIRHRQASEFQSPRDLRTDPVLGWEAYDPTLLYQREKFFEFLQAGLRAGWEFNSPATVLTRCRSLYGNARTIWMALSDLSGGEMGPQEVLRFLESVGAAANAVAEMDGGPLPERRLLSEFPARALSINHPEFTSGLFGLLGAEHVNSVKLADWLEPWRAAFLAAAEAGSADPRVHAARLNYYEKAIRALLEGEAPLGGLWPLIVTWTLAVTVLEDPHAGTWRSAAQQLGLIGPAAQDRLSGLDSYLDDIEAVHDQFASANGLETLNTPL
jgi:hypothetical protein